jgi:hypothetical protein
MGIVAISSTRCQQRIRSANMMDCTANKLQARDEAKIESELLLDAI